MMWFVVTICLYLGLWQLELFSCFLFLGEFTILIFYYCLFLHLRASTSQGTVTGSYSLLAVTALVFSTLLAFWLLGVGYLAVTGNDLTILYIDLYRRVSDFVLNDLVALYYFFIHANLAMHTLIGLILFVLTIYLFLVVSLYAGLNIARRQAYKSVNSKLFTTKGYYEQTAMFSQKYFSNDDNRGGKGNTSSSNTKLNR
jgi:hypothetical protein